jgi:hypothetical protein
MSEPCPGSGNLSLGGNKRMVTCQRCGLLVLRVDLRLVDHERKAQ